MALPWESRVYDPTQQFLRRRSARLIQRRLRQFQRRRWMQRNTEYDAMSESEQDRLSMLPEAASLIARRYRRLRLVQASQTGQLAAMVRRYLTQIEVGQ